MAAPLRALPALAALTVLTLPIHGAAAGLAVVGLGAGDQAYTNNLGVECHVSTAFVLAYGDDQVQLLGEPTSRSPLARCDGLGFLHNWIFSWHCNGDPEATFHCEVEDPSGGVASITVAAQGQLHFEWGTLPNGGHVVARGQLTRL